LGGFISFDFNFSPRKAILFYGELLIDDFQIEKSTPSDKEPNELGYVLGLRMVLPFGHSRYQLNLEYDRIANRTYNQKNEWNRYLNNNRLIGSRLGPDSDRFELELKGWIRNGVESFFKYSYMRRGEGSIYSSWDEPWLYQKDFKEEFPKGVVEKTNDFSLGLAYRYNSHLLAKLIMGYAKVSNNNNVLGEEEDSFKFTLNFQYQFIKR